MIFFSNYLSYSHRMGGMTSGHTGCLFVTTLRLSLQLHTATNKERANKLLGEQDVTLSSIEAVYEVQIPNTFCAKYQIHCVPNTEYIFSKYQQIL